MLHCRLRRLVCPATAALAGILVAQGQAAVAYLESPSPSLRARALQAIATLQSRLSTSGPNG